MNKTILLGIGNGLSPRTNFWLITVVGIGYIALGGSKLYQNENEIIGFLWIVLGVLFTSYHLIVQSKHSKLAPKVIISEDTIAYKVSLFKTSKTLQWAELKSITMDAFKIQFMLDHSTEELRYSTSAINSIEIKKAIRTMAQAKQIEVTGG